MTVEEHVAECERKLDAFERRVEKLERRLEATIAIAAREATSEVLLRIGRAALDA